jgi:flagellar hook-associated protein 2
MGITAPGAGSNLDVNAIVSQLMAVEQRPLALLSQRESGYQAKLSAYGTLKGALSAFQSAMQGLSDPNRFQSMKATVGDDSILTATSSGNGKAIPGSYSVEVQQLAQQQKIRSEGFDAPSSVIGSGTLTIQYGTYDGGSNTFKLNSAKSAETITIDPANNTLSGIRDAINSASAGVSATIINDGTNNRLVLTAKDSGAANSIKITVNDDDNTDLDASGLSQLSFDPAAQIGAGKNLVQAQAAQDAKLQIDGIAISKASNIITDAIEGVTLNVSKSNAGSPTQLEVKRDSASVKAAVEEFVKSYNNVNKTLSDLSAYNAATGKAAVLQGDSAALSIQRGMRTVLMNAVTQAPGGYGVLSQIGVSFQKDGSLALDSTKLEAAMSEKFDQIGALFAMRGSSSDSLISYEGATSRTAAGDYAITVNQIAKQGSLVGSQAAGLVISTGVNDQLSVVVDGVAADITLSAGTYDSADALAAEVQTKVNGAPNLAAANVSVRVLASAGILNITSVHYGSASSVNINGGNGAAGLMGASPSATVGVDVSGTINGLPASGAGQVLTAASGGAAEGLRVAIKGGAPGARGNVNFSRGYADQLSKLAADLLASDGVISSRMDGMNASIKDIDRRQENLTQRLGEIEARYRTQFTTLDKMLSSLNQTSQFLQQQLAALPKNNS